MDCLVAVWTTSPTAKELFRGPCAIRTLNLSSEPVGFREKNHHFSRAPAGDGDMTPPLATRFMHPPHGAVEEWERTPPESPTGMSTGEADGFSAYS